MESIRLLCATDRQQTKLNSPNHRLDSRAHSPPPPSIIHIQLYPYHQEICAIGLVQLRFCQNKHLVLVIDSLCWWVDGGGWCKCPTHLFSLLLTSPDDKRHPQDHRFGSFSCLVRSDWRQYASDDDADDQEWNRFALALYRIVEIFSMEFPSPITSSSSSASIHLILCS